MNDKLETEDNPEQQNCCNSQIRCPYCGVENNNSWEINDYLLAGDHDIECCNCGEHFYCDIDMTADYTTYKYKEKK